MYKMVNAMRRKGGGNMDEKNKWNEEAALNNNLSEADLKMSKQVDELDEVSEELADGGDRNEMAELQKEDSKKNR